MDIDLTNTLITAVSTVIVAFLSFLTGKKDVSSISRREVREYQVSNVLEPMDLLLTFSVEKSPNELLSALLVIVEKNYKYIPVIIQNELIVLKQSKSINNASFSHLRTIVASYYNWNKRTMGYPYDRTKIHTKYTPNTERNNFIWNTFQSIIWLIGFASFMIAALFVFSIVIDDPITLPGWLLNGVMYVCSINIAFWIIAFQERRMR